MFYKNLFTHLKSHASTVSLFESREQHYIKVINKAVIQSPFSKVPSGLAKLPKAFHKATSRSIRMPLKPGKTNLCTSWNCVGPSVLDPEGFVFQRPSQGKSRVKIGLLMAAEEKKERGKKPWHPPTMINFSQSLCVMMKIWTSAN